MKKISSNLTFPLKYAYIYLIPLGVLMVLTMPGNSRIGGAVFILFILGFYVVFYRDLSDVFLGEKEIKIREGKKEFEFGFSEISEVTIESINLQPVRIDLNDGRKVRFITADSFGFANKFIVQDLLEIKTSNKALGENSEPLRDSESSS